MYISRKEKRWKEKRGKMEEDGMSEGGRMEKNGWSGIGNARKEKGKG